MSTKAEALLADEAPIWELDELSALIADAQERGTIGFTEIAATLEEVEVTKEQVRELHQHLEDQGIEIVGADGKPATSEGSRMDALAEARTKPASEG
ncbi:MAG: hypothetical protein M3P44_16425, partial [Actinomycetota bacterium]|nr:hypothetical protein [Actinomycetota bacterium]